MARLLRSPSDVLPPAPRPTPPPSSSWIGRGSLAMAALAVLSLAATVLVAQRALSDASDVIVRGEADALMSSVVADLTEEGVTPSAAQLARELETNAVAGLRYVALLDREGKPAFEAGAALLPDTPQRPGQSTVVGRRVRMTSVLFPPRRGHDRPPSPGPRERPPPPPFPVVVIELEPPVIQTLRRDLTRLSVVAAAAGSVLLAFAVAWSRSAKRLATIERRAAREQRLVALGSMSSVMAHELRNPLASLKGHAQLLAEELGGRQRTKAERVVAEAERLEVLTTSLLDFVRDGPIELLPMTPEQLVDRALESLPRERVDVHLEASPARIVADGERLARALHNLVDNALQAGADGQRVDVAITGGAGETVIEVRDRGPGLAPGAEASIFEPFVTTRVRGTGLGLAVARRIAEQHGGTLTGENHPTTGAVFRLRFPAETTT